MSENFNRKWVRLDSGQIRWVQEMNSPISGYSAVMSLPNHWCRNAVKTEEIDRLATDEEIAGQIAYMGEE